MSIDLALWVAFWILYTGRHVWRSRTLRRELARIYEEG